MQTSKIICSLTLFLVIFLSSCGQNSRKTEAIQNEISPSETAFAVEETAPSPSNEELSFNLSYSGNTDVTNQDNSHDDYKRSVSSSAAMVNNNDTTHKFIRTAELRFKVKNVINATYDIEDIVAKNGGFVTLTKLSGDINSIENTRISADSILTTTYYTITNSMMLRVPSQKLDIALKEIAHNIDFLDYRIIQAEDVSLQMLANKLAQRRAAKSGQRITNAIDDRGRKLSETTSAEELLSRKEQEADETTIANLSIADRIAFSTIQLHIYQSQTVKRELTANNENIKAYEPSFGTKFIDALSDGWTILKNIVLFFTEIWGLLLLAVLAYFLYRTLRKKLKRKNEEN